MSCVGSVISVCTSSVSNAKDERSLLQRCVYLRDCLGLQRFNKNSSTAAPFGPHIKISSKTLKECYVLPENCIDEIFTKLAELMNKLKVAKTKPPRTDFTCLSRLARNKVFIDVDCIACKRGQEVGERRHLSFTKSFELIVSTVNTVFEVTTTDGIYMTMGQRSCGYHLFFNSLAYGDGCSVTSSILMDHLENSLRRSSLANVTVDRGCTQMPLPTASHSNTTLDTVPYVCEYGMGWKKVRLNWVDMDSDTLKCFSSIAFPARYDDAVVTPPSKSTPLRPLSSQQPPSPPPRPTLHTLQNTVAKDRENALAVAGVGNEQQHDGRQIDEINKNASSSPLSSSSSSSLLSSYRCAADTKTKGYTDPTTTTDDGKQRIRNDLINECIKNNMSKTTGEYDSNKENTNATAVVVNKQRKRHPGSPISENGGKNDFPAIKRPRIAQGTAAKIKPFNYYAEDAINISPSRELISDDTEPVIHPTEDGVPPTSLVPAPSPTPEQEQQQQQTAEDDNDVASMFTVRTETTDVNSFICPSTSVVPVSVERRRRQARLDRGSRRIRSTGINDGNTPGTAITNNLGSLPYDCENDKTCPFADKRHKAELLCAEEAEAAVSKANLAFDNEGNHRRIYIIPGTSSRVQRDYKLLVQLVNVNRSVYGGDVAPTRKWADLIVSYFDQHLCNPVLLEIVKFVLNNKDVETIFDRAELAEVRRSLVHLMLPFRSRTAAEEANGLAASASVTGDLDEPAEREARPHKVKIVGALIRVCTYLFGMVTAVVSDLRRVRQAMERRDLTLLNRTVVNERHTADTADDRYYNNDYINDDDDDDDDDDDYLDCSASMRGGCNGVRNRTKKAGCTTNYTLLASLIVHEQENLSDQALYAFLYYYHSFPSITIDRIMDEVHHDGLMVTAFIKCFMMYDHRGKPLTLQEIFEGFNDTVVSLSGPENFILIRKKNQKRGSGESKKNAQPPKNGSRKSNDGRNTRVTSNVRNRRRHGESSTDTTMEVDGEHQRGEEDNTADSGGCSSNNNGGGVTREEIDKLLSGAERKRRRMMCNSSVGRRSEGMGDGDGEEERPRYEWKDKHLWQAVINYYLRPVVMHEDRLVFANDSYDTFEDDAVESCVAHIMTKSKNTKADVATSFKDARTVWRMHHSSQYVYESDLMSDTVGCCFHINIALKMYEMFCGGCVTRMKRVHKNYLIDRSRFNMTVYDVVAECRTATVDLTSAIDRSYFNLLLRLPVVPPFLEEDAESRHMFTSDVEMRRGSFCCLNVMDYRRAVNLFERFNCQSKSELETCDYVENFLNDLYTSEVAAESPPDVTAESRMRILYAFYSLYLYEVVFNMRHTYAVRENCHLSIERLSYELDVHELLILFFGKSGMKRFDGLGEELQGKIQSHITGNNSNNDKGGNAEDDSFGNRESSGGGMFDIRPASAAADIPDKMQRMKTLFGQFGFDVMRDIVETTTTQSLSNPLLSSSSSSSLANNNNNNDDNSNTDVPSTSNCMSDNNDKDHYDGNNSESYDDSDRNSQQTDRNWGDESKFEYEFYASENWTDNVCERIRDTVITGKTNKHSPMVNNAGMTCGGLFLVETVRSIMRLELKRHIDHHRLAKLTKDECKKVFAEMKLLPLRLKLLAFILTTHTFKLRTKTIATDFIEDTYGEAGDDTFHFPTERDGEIYDDYATMEKDSGADGVVDHGEPPEKVWCRTVEALLNDRRSLLSYARWLAEKRFKNNFFVGLDPKSIYGVLYEYMKDNQDRYPAFKKYNDNENTRLAATNLCTAMMYILVMSAFDQEHVDLYLKVFLAVEWPGQWAKTIFVWKSNSNAGKSYLFDSIIKHACANSTCINDPKGGKENAPEKAEYVRNFVLFANEFSQANSNELKKIVSESTFKFRMNYGNIMNEAYATGKIMFNCNTLPPTSDEAAINRLTLFNIPFWFGKRHKISDAMLNWICGLKKSGCTQWENAYRYLLPSLLTETEKIFLKKHDETNDETDLFDEFTAMRPVMCMTNKGQGTNRAWSSLFLVQNKISGVYPQSQPPTDRIVFGMVNITNHFSWLRFFKRLETPVDFSILPTTSEAVRSEWLSLTLPYQEWKQQTGAKIDPSSRVSADTVNKSLQAFAAKKNIDYFKIRQFFDTDFASSREAIKDEYYMRFDSKVFGD